jgi:hypothetical protein
VLIEKASAKWPTDTDKRVNKLAERLPKGIKTLIILGTLGVFGFVTYRAFAGEVERQEYPKVEILSISYKTYR